MTGMVETPVPAWKDEAGTVRLVVGFGSDSNDRIVGTVKLGRARASDEAQQVVAAAAVGGGGWVRLSDPVYSNADQRGPVAGAIAVRVERIAWVVRWADFQGAHGLVDEAARS